MIDIYLHGYLADKFGSHHLLEVDSPAEAIRALNANYPGFYAAIRPAQFAVLRGEDIETGESLHMEQLGMIFRKKPIHFVPVPQGGGSNSKGIFQVILGVALIALSFVPGGQVGLGAGFSTFMSSAMPVIGFVSRGAVLMMGAAMALGGIVQLMTPAPTINDYQNGEDKKLSFVFNGPANRIEQGGAKPIIYGGPIEYGGTIVSAGIKVNGSPAVEPEENRVGVNAAITLGGSPVEGEHWMMGMLLPGVAAINPSGSFRVIRGSSITFNVTCTNWWEYKIASVKVNGADWPIETNFTVENIQSDLSVAVDLAYISRGDGTIG